MLITTDMKVVDLLQRHQKEFLNAAYASPQLYPITHDREVLFETFSLFATIFPEGTLADLLDFMAGSRASSEVRQAAFAQLAEKREHHAQVERARELADVGAVLPKSASVAEIPHGPICPDDALARAKPFLATPIAGAAETPLEPAIICAKAPSMGGEGTGALPPAGMTPLVPKHEVLLVDDLMEEEPANAREKLQKFVLEDLVPKTTLPKPANPFANLASKR
jgi:hypothetical protein